MPALETTLKATHYAPYFTANFSAYNSTKLATHAATVQTTKL